MDRIRVMIYDKKSRTLICWKEYYNLKEAERYCESVKKLKEIFVRCQQVK
jgi:flagellin-specific chaperone FliS